MSLRLSSAPATEPVTLTEAKNHLRVDISNDDDLITALIQASREWIEKYTNSVLITQTWEYQRDYGFPHIFRLAKNPVQSVSSITYTDGDGVTQTVTASDYVLDENQWPARVYEACSASWPTTRVERNAVKVTFVAGYGAAADVPSPIKAAILLMVGHLYENREASAPIVITEIPMGVKALISPYVLSEFA